MAPATFTSELFWGPHDVTRNNPSGCQIGNRMGYFASGKRIGYFLLWSNCLRVSNTIALTSECYLTATRREIDSGMFIEPSAMSVDEYFDRWLRDGTHPALKKLQEFMIKKTA